MDIKVLIGILGRHWLMEPSQAEYWGSVAKQFITTGNVPAFDKRSKYGGYADYGAVFRVDENGKVSTSGSIQVFKMQSPVAKYDYCGSPGSQTWMQLLQAANEDPTISSILLWIDSPGGQVDGTESLANDIQASPKPVVAFADSMMCSGAYWLGSSARYIIADNSNNGWNAVIGSIGTMAQMYDDTGALEKEGYVRHLIFADASKDKWSNYFSMRKGDFTRLKAELNGINDTFLNSVKTNRDGKLDLQKEDVLTGKTYNATEAVKYGLVDATGTFIDAVKMSAKLGKQYIAQQKNDKMTKNNVLPFAKVLTAAKAETFEVVEGGFLATEPQLEAIEAQLDAHETAQATHAAALQTAADATAAAEAKATAAEEKATAAAQKLAEAEAKLATANERIQELEGELEAAGTDPGKFFRNQGNPIQVDDNTNTDDAVLDQLEHNKKADAVLRGY